MKRHGLIDLGSNSVRLVVYDVKRNFGKRLRKSEFTTVLNEKDMAGLSAYVEDGIFTDAGIEKASDVLLDHLENAHKIDCNEVHIFATAVLRNCENSKQATKDIERTIDHKIDLISGQDEAHLGFVGASINNVLEEGVLIDIGGGSTELTSVESGRDTKNVSLDQGSVSSYATFVSAILPTQEEMENIRQAFAKRLESALADIHEPKLSKGVIPMFGIGGSVRAVAKMRTRMLGKDKPLKRIELDDVLAVLDFLESGRSAFAHMAVKAVPDRLHTLIPGCVMLKEAMQAFDSDALTVCKYGIREGYLAERILGQKEIG